MKITRNLSFGQRYVTPEAVLASLDVVRRDPE